MSQNYRAILVGTGSVADAHVRAIEETHGRVRLVSAVDTDAERVKAFCQRHQVPAARTDYRVALREDAPDLVLIAAPPAVHTVMSIAAMEAGAWVFCEKPLCASLAEFDRIAEAEQRTGRYTACVFQQRFGSSTAHLRRLAAEGLLGRPLVAVCHTLWFRDAGYYAVPWRGKWTTELGGPTLHTSTTPVPRIDIRAGLAVGQIHPALQHPVNIPAHAFDSFRTHQSPDNQATLPQYSGL